MEDWEVIGHIMSQSFEEGADNKAISEKKKEEILQREINELESNEKKLLENKDDRKKLIQVSESENITKESEKVILTDKKDITETPREEKLDENLNKQASIEKDKNSTKGTGNCDAKILESEIQQTNTGKALTNTQQTKYINQNVSTDESSDDEVLSKIQAKIQMESLQKPIALRKKKRNVKRKKFSSSESEDEHNFSSDNSVKDPLFKLQKKDVLSSESESDTISNQKKQRQTKQAKGLKKFVSVSMKSINQNFTRNIGWKKKPTALGKKKKTTPGRPHLPTKCTNKMQVKKKLFVSPNKRLMESPGHQSITEAKQRSLVTLRARQLLYKIHTRNLDALLFSNGLKRHEIEGDGNCFFAAVNKGLTNDGNHVMLRRVICDHLQNHPEEYIHFLTNDSHPTEDQALQMYQEQVAYLREDGKWSTNLADALPLATANTLKRDILILSSDRKRPILKISPTQCEPVEEQHLSLAYIAIPGLEHFDACTKLDDKNSKHNDLEISTETTPRKVSKQSGTEQPPIITPRKQAKYRSPKKKLRTRKRISRPETWKKNIRKHCRLSGKQYISATGKTMREKAVQFQDCAKCRFKCTGKIPEKTREELFNLFWNLKDYSRQRDFFCSTVKVHTPDRIRPSAKRPRKCSKVFTFNVNGDDVRICKQFYTKTLDVGEKTIDYALKSNKSGIFTSEDKRGTHIPHNKTPEQSILHIRQHIESFPVLDPHYTRKDTHRKFLGSELNITKMYRLYREECIAAKRKPVGSSKYRKVFCTEYNYSFHTPKKDQCQTCCLYLEKQANNQINENDKTIYDQHIQRKIKAREEKSLDKNFSKTHPEYHVATFDLQAVLHTPCSNVSQVYYKRKLNCYNSSFYSLGNGKATCFVWNETEAKRGSNEIGTCIVSYIRSLPLTTTQVCIYSDNCPGQNRNRFIPAALLHALLTTENIQTADQKFLEPGHTEMECDSMHAAIESAKKNTPVYVPSQWDTIIRMARRRKPYTVVPLKYCDILNFKDVAKKMFPANSVDGSGKKIQWMQLKWIQFRKREPDCMFFKYEYDEEEFHCLRMKVASRKSGILHIGEKVPQCYKEKLPISEKKKSDLVTLCNNGIIPEEFSGYYKNLKSSSSVNDSIAEPDLYEEQEDTDEEKE